MSSSRRVVITGMGLVGPLGNDLDDFWSALTSGRSGIRPLTLVPTDHLPVSFGGEATEFTGDIKEFGQLEAAQKKAIRKGLKVMCREIQMGVAASQLALQHSGLNTDALNRERTGIVFGSDYIMTNPLEFERGVRNCMTDESFNFQLWAEQGLPQVTPLWLLKYLPNMPACHVGIYNDLRGPNNSITNREASANLALAEAFCTIERGHADAVLSGATGTRIHPLKTVQVALQEELATTTDPASASRPFEANRTGMVIGEGAASLVLEELTHAENRGANIVAEIVGFGSSTVISKSSIACRHQAIVNSVRQALRIAGMTADDIGHVNAHGLSSVKSDREEAQAINELFRGRSTPVPVVAPKSGLGNIGAGGGAMELIASIQALNSGHLFKTLNYETPDPECPIFVVTSNDVAAGDSVLNINVSLQGQAAVLIVQRFK